MHKAQAVLNEYFDLLTSMVSGDVKELIKGGAEIPRQYPSIRISMGGDTSERFDIKNVRQNLSVYIDIYVSSTSSDFDAEILSIRDKVHNRIMADGRLGLDYVFETRFEGQEAPQYTSEGQDFAASTRLEFITSYLTAIESQTA